MKAFWGILLFALLAACSPSPVAITPYPTVNIVPTNTATIPPKLPTEIVLSDSAPATENISIATSIVPQVETIAPTVREVKLSDLGLSNTTRLILYFQPSDSLRIMSGHDIQPQRIPNIQPQAYMWSGVEISPNQKWFIYQVFTEKRENIAYYDFWVSSIDGKEQKIAVSNVRGATRARWVSNEHIELWYYPDGVRACPQRESIVNPFTQEIMISLDVPDSTKPHCFYDLSTNPDRTKIIYLNNGLWSIYDFRTKQNQIVFPWFSESDRFDVVPRNIQWSERGITLVIPRQESIVFKVDLPASDISENGIVLSKVLLPDGKKLYNETFSWWALDKGFIGFDLVQSDFNYVESGDETPLSDFVILDLKSSILYDYNLDRARTGEMQNVSDSFVHASADNRFLAWTIYRSPGMSNPIETVVLDRKTGQIARIKGFEFFGWGEINQP